MVNTLIPAGVAQAVRSSSELIALEGAYGARNYHPLDVVLARGQGVFVWDVEGNRYMDFLSAYSAVNQGHCHPRIIEALTIQAQKLTLTSRAFRNDQLGPFYEEICALTNSHMVLPMNSGAEAVETVIKAVRKWGYETKGVAPGQAELIALGNNFHGRTITIVGFSTEEQYQKGFGPFAPGFRVVPYGDAAALEAAITPNTVGVLAEPIQGEAGIIIPPAGYMPRVRALCTQHGIPLILDEIQTGLGRTGKLLAEEHEGIVADITLVGKALSGGVYPISAVLSNSEVLGVFKPGDHGSTYGGNPLACAVARAAMKVLIEEGMIENSAHQGAWFMEQLRRIKAPIVKEVRGRGLMIGIELHADAGPARPRCEKLMRRGMLCKDTHGSVIRLAPPLVITREQLHWALDQVSAVLLEG